jgi:ribonucleoside-diphosphate reductase beta chain
VWDGFDKRQKAMVVAPANEEASGMGDMFGGVAAE